MLRKIGRVLLLLAVAGTQTPVWAATIKACVKNANGSLRIVASASACSSSETFLEWNKNGPYGDGSAGAVTFTDPFVNLPNNAQFTDLTIPAGTTLFLEAGAVVRCTGTFTNNGLIIVRDTQNGGDLRPFNAGALYPSFVAPDPGISQTAALVGELGDATADRIGGFGGRGWQSGLPRNQPLIPREGGGGGAGRFSNGPSPGEGGEGGGSAAILAQVAIVNAGTIRANGNQTVSGPGGGGGGGGVLLLASSGSITHTGSIEALGGSGAVSDQYGGPGGGGGGGYVRFFAPSITNTGVINVSGGVAGPASAPGAINASLRQGGGGGGASLGTGGQGGTVLADGGVSIALPGQNGQVVQTIGDPTSLF
jgi:hypothetical protein